MTITPFQRHCKPGCRVVNTPKNKEGVVLRISKDCDKALVEYANGSKEWNHYYVLEIIKESES